MRRVICRLAVVCVVLGVPLSAVARDVYVAKEGDDANPGTKEKPLASVAESGRGDARGGAGDDLDRAGRILPRKGPGVRRPARRHGRTAVGPARNRAGPSPADRRAGRGQLSPDHGRRGEAAHLAGSETARPGRRLEGAGLPAAGAAAGEASRPRPGGSRLRRSADAIGPLAERRVRRVRQGDRFRGVGRDALGVADRLSARLVPVPRRSGEVVGFRPRRLAARLLVLRVERRGLEGGLLRPGHRRVATGGETRLRDRLAVAQGLEASVLCPARVRGTRPARRVLSRSAEQPPLLLAARRRDEDARATDALPAAARSGRRLGLSDRPRSDDRKRLRRGHRDEQRPALPRGELPGPQHGPQRDFA